MNKLEKQLLRDETGGAEPRFCIGSDSRIDTGRWWRRSRIWLCVMADELVLLAVGRRRYFERITIAECGRSHYNAGAGQLVIEPGESLRHSRFTLPPQHALRILSLLNTENRTLKTTQC